MIPEAGALTVSAGLRGVFGLMVSSKLYAIELEIVSLVDSVAAIYLLLYVVCLEFGGYHG